MPRQVRAQGAAGGRRRQPDVYARRPAHDHDLRARDGLGGLLERGGQPALVDLPSRAPARADRGGRQADLARRLHARAAKGEDVLRRQQRLWRGPEPGGRGAGRGVAVAQHDPSGRVRAVVRDAAVVWQLADRVSARGIQHAPAQEKGQEGQLARQGAHPRAALQSIALPGGIYHFLLGDDGMADYNDPVIKGKGGKNPIKGLGRAGGRHDQGVATGVQRGPERRGAIAAARSERDDRRPVGRARHNAALHETIARPIRSRSTVTRSRPSV